MKQSVKIEKSNSRCTNSDAGGRRRRQRYCTTGQGAPGPEGGRGGGGGEESPAFSDRPLVSSQPCQQEPVTHSQHWGRNSEKNIENDRNSAERRNQGNTVGLKGRRKVVVRKSVQIYSITVHVCMFVCLCVVVVVGGLTYHRTRLVQAWRTLLSLLAL